MDKFEAKFLMFEELLQKDQECLERELQEAVQKRMEKINEMESLGETLKDLWALLAEVDAVRGRVLKYGELLQTSLDFKGWELKERDKELLGKKKECERLKVGLGLARGLGGNTQTPAEALQTDGMQQVESLIKKLRFEKMREDSSKKVPDVAANVPSGVPEVEIPVPEVAKVPNIAPKVPRGVPEVAKVPSIAPKVPRGVPEVAKVSNISPKVSNGMPEVPTAASAAEKITFSMSDSFFEKLARLNSNQTNEHGASSARVEGPDKGSRARCDKPMQKTRNSKNTEKSRDPSNDAEGAVGGNRGPGHRNQSDSQGLSGPKRAAAVTGPDKCKVVREVNGDLFSVPQGVALAHCVGADLKMGTGIAADFRAKFKRVDELLEQRRGVGEVALLKVEGRYIYYMITKSSSTGKPRIQDVAKAVEEVRDHAVSAGVAEVAMPRIGCGLDGLDWRQVKPAIVDAFRDSGVQVTVYNFQPHDSNDRRNENDQRNENDRRNENDQRNENDRRNENDQTKGNVHIAHVKYPLVDIEATTGLIFFGSADGEIVPTSLSTKYGPVLKEFDKEPRKVGQVVRIVPPAGDILYGLVVKECKSDRLSNLHLQECMRNLRRFVVVDRYERVGLEAFLEGGSVSVINQVLNILSEGIKPTPKRQISIYVCWPEHLKYHVFKDVAQPSGI